jgi:aspartate racemase
MRTIGMLGGMSPESTVEYYRLANAVVRERLGGLHSARMVLHSVDFADFADYQMQGRWGEAADVLARAAQGLEAAGAELLLICTNTFHLVADQVQAAVDIPLLHIVDPAAAAARAAGVSSVALLGTAFTMDKDFYRDRLASHGLRVLVPDGEDHDVVHRVIFDELVRGIVSEDSREAYRGVVRRLVDRGAEGIVLGCTEIELLLSEDDASVPLFPTTRLHVEAAVAFALE